MSTTKKPKKGWRSLPFTIRNRDKRLPLAEEFAPPARLTQEDLKKLL